MGTQMSVTRLSSLKLSFHKDLKDFWGFRALSATSMMPFCFVQGRVSRGEYFPGLLALLKLTVLLTEQVKNAADILSQGRMVHKGNIWKFLILKPST